MYIPLHGHSTFSFLEAIGKPKDIVKKAKEL
jgi:DNA polymerase III alpha subunit